MQEQAGQPEADQADPALSEPPSVPLAERPVEAAQPEPPESRDPAPPDAQAQPVELANPDLEPQEAVLPEARFDLAEIIAPPEEPSVADEAPVALPGEIGEAEPVVEEEFAVGPAVVAVELVTQPLPVEEVVAAEPAVPVEAAHVLEAHAVDERAAEVPSEDELAPEDLALDELPVKQLPPEELSIQLLPEEPEPAEQSLPEEPSQEEVPAEQIALEEPSIEQLLPEEPPAQHLAEEPPAAEQAEALPAPVPLHERIPLVEPSAEVHAKTALDVPVFEQRTPQPAPPPPPEPVPVELNTSTAAAAAVPAPSWLPAPVPVREAVVAAPPVVVQPPVPLGEILWPLARRLVRAAFIAGVAAFALILVLIVAYRWINPPMSTLMFGQWLTGTRITQRWVPIERISPYLYRAVITSEDGRFCYHRGVDWSELEAAIERARDGIPRGGSTISMQVVKNLFLWPSKSYVRKAIEIPLTYAIELAWPKRRILEIYLNIAEWGPGIFGAEAASRYHFGKPAALLTSGQAALLAVSLPNPRERKAGRPGPGTQRLAATIQQRMQAGTGNAACIRP